MAFLEILLPQLMRCGQQCGTAGGQAFNTLMDQDWNHWKLQMQSWMDDVNGQMGAQGAPPGAAPAAAAGNCGQRCGAESTGDAGVGQGLDALLRMWSQFATANNQQPSNSRQSSGGQSSDQVKNDSRKLVIKLDVQNFEPQELSVKIVDNHIVVTGEHPERTDRLSLISRRFQRRYPLTDDIDADTVVSTLTADGVLIVEALKKSTDDRPAGGAIVIPVVREGSTDGGAVGGQQKSTDYENDHQMD
ncbi:protein lethal(2)essential for life-like [Oppia nitens]|uniref:protein lethal(2)essential for life-like n=1 Tax=Oppia nitens TaxID=1686743 RepID=UPI0023DAF316|nr:protein lethal(2)essential for life-like [Oppia nitens]